MAGFVFILVVLAELFFKVSGVSLVNSNLRNESNEDSPRHDIKRSGVFLRIQTQKPSLSPTVQQYDKFPIPMTRNIPSNNKTVLKKSEDLNKVKLVQPETFSKPTSIPPIGNLLVTSPTSQIKPIASQMLNVDEPGRLGPISEQFIRVDGMSKIGEMPKMPEIEKIEDFFKDDMMEKDFKKEVIDRVFGKKYKRFLKAKKAKKKLVNVEYDRIKRRFWTPSNKKLMNEIFMIAPYSSHLTLNQLKNKVKLMILGRKRSENGGKPFVASTLNIKRRFWTPNIAKKWNEVFLIAPRESRLTSRQVEERVRKTILGTRGGNKKVFIPPPSPIEIKKLEPFQKEKDIEDISKQSLQVEKPEPIEDINQHLQKIESQPDISLISEQLMTNRPVEPIADIDPIESLTDDKP